MPDRAAHLLVHLSVRPLLTAVATIAALAAHSPLARAQGAAEVRGVVWDSVARAPLADATVQLVDAANPSASVAARATTDSAGRFVLTDVRPARYLATFMHPTLDALGVEPPVRMVNVVAPLTRVELATPAPARLFAPLCGAAADTMPVGAVVGLLRDAGSGAPAGGTVTVRWAEFVVGAGGMRQRIRLARAGADSVTGRFLLCGVPADAELALRASRGADTTGEVPVEPVRHGVVRRDLWVGTTAAGDPGVRLNGRVRGEAGRAIPNARVLVIGDAAHAFADSSGVFRLFAPPGTRTVEVRALGFAPERRVVDFVRGAEPRLDVTLTSLKTVLDTVRVTAQRAYSNYGNGFERRRRSGTGKFIDAAQVERMRPARFSEVLRNVPGLRVDEGIGSAAGITMRGDAVSCTPTVFLDGHRLPDMDLRDLDSFVLPSDIGLVEVYTSTQAPAEFTTLDGCGVIVVWTRQKSRPPPLPRRKP
jgi:hypothetical protein